MESNEKLAVVQKVVQSGCGFRRELLEALLHMDTEVVEGALNL